MVLQKPSHPLFLLFGISYDMFYECRGSSTPLRLADSPVQLAIGTNQPGMAGMDRARLHGFDKENCGWTYIYLVGGLATPLKNMSQWG